MISGISALRKPLDRARAGFGITVDRRWLLSGGAKEGLAKFAAGSRNGGLAKIRHCVLLDLQIRPMGPTCNIPNFASSSKAPRGLNPAPLPLPADRGDGP